MGNGGRATVPLPSFQPPDWAPCTFWVPAFAGTTKERGDDGNRHGDHSTLPVIPAQAGIQYRGASGCGGAWIPAFAGMT